MALFAEKVYTTTPTHNSVFISVKLWLIDKWISTDNFNFYVYSNDGSKIFDQNIITIEYDEQNWTTNICGNTYHDLQPLTIFLQSPHTGSSIKVGFYQAYGVNIQAGVRDINIILSTYTLTSSSVCNKISSPPNVLVATRAAETISNVGLMLTIFTSQSGSVAVSSGALAKALQYSRFINVTSYSASLQTVFKEAPATAGFLPFSPKIPAAFENGHQDHQLPYKFRLYHLHSSYVVNFWKDLMSLAIAFAITTLLVLFEYLFSKINKQSKIYLTITKLRNSFLSFFLLQLHLISGDVWLYFSLQMITTKSYSTSFDGSFIACLVFVIVSLLMLIIHGIILLKYQALKKQATLVNSESSNALLEFTNKYKTFQFFTQNYKDHSLYSQAFLLFFIIRIILTSCIIGFLWNYPLFQAVLLTTMSTLMIVYILIVRPFKTFLEFIQQLLYEVILGLINIGILLIANMESNKYTSDDLVDNVSSLIFMCNLFMKVLPMISMLVTVILLIYHKLKTTKKSGQGRAGVISIIPSKPINENNLNRNHQQREDDSFEKQLRPVNISHISEVARNNSQDKIQIKNCINLEEIEQESYEINSQFNQRSHQIGMSNNRQMDVSKEHFSYLNYTQNQQKSQKTTTTHEGQYINRNTSIQRLNGEHIQKGMSWSKMDRRFYR